MTYRALYWMCWYEMTPQTSFRGEPESIGCGFGQELADGSSSASIINEAFSINRPECLVALRHGRARLREQREKEQ